MRVLVLFNETLLEPTHPDWASEAGVRESVDAITAALVSRGHAVEQLGLKDSLRLFWDVVDGPRRPDVVCNLCEGFRGSSSLEPHLAALVELAGLPCTGSGPETLWLVRDKPRTKWLLLGAGLPTPDFRLFPPGAPPTDETLSALFARGPLFVKPAAQDASLGIGPDSVVTEPAALQRQVAEVHRRYGDALVEQYVPGREFNVGIVALGEPRVLPLAEIAFVRDADGKWPIVTYDAKWKPPSRDYQATPVICPADLAPEPAQRIARLALAAYRCTGCRGYARVDLRGDPQAEIFILEVNANPDLSPAAGFARALQAGGMAYDEFAHRLVEVAVEEWQARDRRGPP